MLPRRAFLLSGITAGLGFLPGLSIGRSEPRVWTFPTGVDALGERWIVPSLERLISGVELGGDARAQALQIQYAVHVSKPYGAAAQIWTLDDFLTLERAHCGDYAVAQHALNLQYRLTSRMLTFTDGWHGWVEVRIDGAWETFDSTTNVWLNQPMAALIAGVDRHYRSFYAPALDPTAPDVYRAHLREGYSVPGLRRIEPFFGKTNDLHFAPIVALEQNV